MTLHTTDIHSLKNNRLELHDSTGDLRSISEYTLTIETKEETDKNQLELF